MINCNFTFQLVADSRTGISLGTAGCVSIVSLVTLVALTILQYLPFYTYYIGGASFLSCLFIGFLIATCREDKSIGAQLVVTLPEAGFPNKSSPLEDHFSKKAETLQSFSISENGDSDPLTEELESFQPSSLPEKAAADHAFEESKILPQPPFIPQNGNPNQLPHEGPVPTNQQETSLAIAKEVREAQQFIEKYFQDAFTEHLINKDAFSELGRGKFLFIKRAVLTPQITYINIAIKRGKEDGALTMAIAKEEEAFCKHLEVLGYEKDENALKVKEAKGLVEKYFKDTFAVYGINKDSFRELQPGKLQFIKRRILTSYQSCSSAQFGSANIIIAIKSRKEDGALTMAVAPELEAVEEFFCKNLKILGYDKDPVKFDDPDDGKLIPNRIWETKWL